LASAPDEALESRGPWCGLDGQTDREANPPKGRLTLAEDPEEGQLDVLALLFELERTFRLRVPLRDLEHVHTAGDLWRYLYRRMSLTPGEGSLHDWTHQRLHIALRDRVPPAWRTRLDGDTRLALVMPEMPASRGTWWRDLQQDVGLKLPKLQICPDLQARMARAFEFGCLFNLVVSLVLLLAAGFLGHSAASAAGSSASTSTAATAASAAVGLVAAKLFLMALPEGLLHSGLTWLFAAPESRQRVHLPRELVSVDDLTAATTAGNFTAVCKQAGFCNPDDVWTTLRWLLAKHANHRPEDIHRQTTLRTLNDPAHHWSATPPM